VNVRVEGELLRRELEALLGKPFAPHNTPGHARQPPALAEAELRQPVPVAHPIKARGLACADEVAGSLQLRGGHMDRLQQPARSSRASLRASRLSVLTRSPGRCGTSPGATTRQSMPRSTR